MRLYRSNYANIRVPLLQMTCMASGITIGRSTTLAAQVHWETAYGATVCLAFHIQCSPSAKRIPFANIYISVNFTETYQALSLITKAGVPASKVVVGVTSYARSFEMEDPSCTGPNCLFTGPASGATPGQCTNVRRKLRKSDKRS